MGINGQADYFRRKAGYGNWGEGNARLTRGHHGTQAQVTITNDEVEMKPCKVMICVKKVTFCAEACERVLQVALQRFSRQKANQKPCYNEAFWQAIWVD
jgi:hypothetical protein